MNLYQINQQILESCDPITGEINEELLEKLEAEKEEKLESIALWIKNLDAEAKAIKVEEQSLKARREANEKKIESLKKYLTDNLNGEEFTTPKVGVKFRKSTSVNISDLKVIPKKWFIKQEPKLDKAGIKKALSEGKKVKGAELIVNSNIQIK